LVLRHKTSVVPSPLKSPRPANCQTLDTELTALPPVNWPLVIIHVSTSPVAVLSHKASLEPSPLKSPVPSSCHAPETLPRPAPPVTRPFVIVHVCTAPLVVLRQMRSLVPSPFTSPGVIPRMATSLVPPLPSDCTAKRRLGIGVDSERLTTWLLVLVTFRTVPPLTAAPATDMPTRSMILPGDRFAIVPLNVPG